jgi:hypothetical protein
LAHHKTGERWSQVKAAILHEFGADLVIEDVDIADPAPD